MIYIEYMDRDRHMPMEIFRLYADQASWTDPDDGMVGLFGRTMRLGPYPAYLAFWQCKGMARLDEWEAFFRSDAFLDHEHERATFQAIHLACAGCYDELVQSAPPDRERLFAIEYFALPAAASDDEVVDAFRGRERAVDGAGLEFLLRRIGDLGPAPGSLAVWSFADYAALEPFQRARRDDDPFPPSETGVYRWFGRDIL